MKSLVLLLGLCALLVGCGGSEYPFEKGELVYGELTSGDGFAGYYHKETKTMLILRETKDGDSLIWIAKSKIEIVYGTKN